MQVDLKFPVATRVIIVDDTTARADMLSGILQKQGVTILAVIDDAQALAQNVAAHEPDAVILSTSSPDAALLGQVEGLQQSGGCPIVLLSQEISGDKLRAAVAAGINAVVLVGLNGNNLTSAIELAVADYSQCKSLLSRAAEAERALKERKIIERAKGTLMKQRNIDESVAYHLMRRRAMAQGKRLVEVAGMINEAAEMLMETQHTAV